MQCQLSRRLRFWPIFTHKCSQKSAVYVHHLLANPIKEARGFCGIFTRQSSGPSCSALETGSDNLLLKCLFTGQNEFPDDGDNS